MYVEVEVSEGYSGWPWGVSRRWKQRIEWEMALSELTLEIVWAPVGFWRNWASQVELGEETGVHRRVMFWKGKKKVNWSRIELKAWSKCNNKHSLLEIYITHTYTWKTYMIAIVQPRYTHLCTLSMSRPLTSSWTSSLHFWLVQVQKDFVLKADKYVCTCAWHDCASLTLIIPGYGCVPTGMGVSPLVWLPASISGVVQTYICMLYTCMGMHTNTRGTP